MQLNIIRSKKRKRLAFGMSDNLDILNVYAPINISENAIKKIVEANFELIEKLKLRHKVNRKYKFFEGEKFLLLGKEYELKFSRKVIGFDNGFIVPAGDELLVQESLEKLYIKLAKNIMTEKTLKIFNQFKQHLDNKNINNISITSATTRWGSCSSKGTLSFSWRLILWPEDIIDYVIIHELAHLKELNHSKNFWSLVEVMCPDYQEKLEKLKSNVNEYSTW